MYKKRKYPNFTPNLKTLNKYFRNGYIKINFRICDFLIIKVKSHVAVGIWNQITGFDFKNINKIIALR